MADGWIKLHRKILESPLWNDCTPEQKVIMITLLLMANSSGKKWIFEGNEYECKTGQFITSLKNIQEKSGKNISIMQIRRCLEKFEKHDFLTSKATNKNRLISITNWELYQSEMKKETSKATSNRQATDKQPTPNKNNKNNKNNIYSSNEHDKVINSIWKNYPNKKGKKESIKLITNLLKKHTEDEIIKSINLYITDVKKQRDSGFSTLNYKNGDTFFRTGIYDYLGVAEAEEEKSKSKEKELLKEMEILDNQVLC